MSSFRMTVGYHSRIPLKHCFSVAGRQKAVFHATFGAQTDDGFDSRLRRR
jgi:hypothetical protein